MSTEEIIQRTRLLDSEIKVGIQAGQGDPCRPPRGSMGTAVSSLDQKKRRETQTLGGTRSGTGVLGYQA